MVDWKNKVDLSQEWRRARNGELTAQQLSRVIAIKLSRFIQWASDQELVTIRADFNALALNAAASFDDFDVILEALYNWADVDHRLWVATS